MLFLVLAPAAAQKVPSRGAFERFGADAARELGRGLSGREQELVSKAVRDAIQKPGGKSGADIVSHAVLGIDREFGRRGLQLSDDLRSTARLDSVKLPRLKLKLEGGKPSAGSEEPTSSKAEPSATTEETGTSTTSKLLHTTLQSIVRRREIIDELRGRVENTLEPRRDDAGTQAGSELERFLAEELKIADYADVAASFDSRAKVEWVELSEEVALLRLYGGDSKPLGRYLFCCVESGAAPASGPKFTGPFMAWTNASGLATPPANILGDLAIVRIPAGTKVLVGTVADNFPDANGTFQPGGNTQIFVPTVKNFPFARYRLAGNSADPRDVAVVLKDRVVRFRPDRPGTVPSRDAPLEPKTTEAAQPSSGTIGGSMSPATPIRAAGCSARPF